MALDTLKIPTLCYFAKQNHVKVPKQGLAKTLIDSAYVPCVGPGPDPTPVDPPYMTDLHAQFDFSNIAGYTLDGSDNVVAVIDVSGNGNDLDGGAGGGDVTITTLQGLDAANFDQRILRSQAYATAPMPYSIFVVGTINDDLPESTSNYLFKFTGDSARLTDGVDTTFALNYAPVVEPDWASSSFAMGTPVSTGMSIADASTATVGADTAGTTERSPVNVAHSAVRSGILPNAAIGFASGQSIIGEVLIYTKAMSGTEFDEVMSYLNTKWNIR